MPLPLMPTQRKRESMTALRELALPLVPFRNDELEEEALVLPATERPIEPPRGGRRKGSSVRNRWSAKLTGYCEHSRTNMNSASLGLSGPSDRWRPGSWSRRYREPSFSSTCTPKGNGCEKLSGTDCQASLYRDLMWSQLMRWESI